MAQRQNTLLLKRSNVIGKIPPISGLTLGELAFNTADTILYGSFTSGTTGATEIREVGWNRIHRTGDTVTGNFNFYGNIQISGASQPSGNALSVTGTTNLIGNTNQIGNFNITGNTNQLGNLSLSGNASLNNLSAITITFDTTYTGATPYGVMAWNPDFGVPQVGLIGGNVSQKIGESIYAYVRNAETTTLTRGEVVYIFGASGDKMTVKRASATGDTTSSKTLGVVAESITANQLGYVITQGTLDGLNLGTYTAGDIVWLSITPGQFTKVKQYAPVHLVFVGVVQRANNGNGQLYVKPQNGYEVEELHDVIATGATYGDLLVYSAFSGNDVWVSSKTLTGNYTISGNTTQIGNFNITGNTIQSGSTTQVGNYNVTGNTNQLGYNYIVSATTGCTLAVTGTTCLTGPLNVTGATFISGNICHQNAFGGGPVTGTTGINCLDTTLIPSGTTIIHQFQGEGGILAHLGDLATGEPNSRGYTYFENNTTLTSFVAVGTGVYTPVIGAPQTVQGYNNFFIVTTGATTATTNKLTYNYPPASGSSFTYLKFTVSLSVELAQNQQLTFQIQRTRSLSATTIPIGMSITPNGNTANGLSFNGIAEALHQDEFVLVVRNATGSGGSNSVRITDVSFSMFT
jgi:hypothetical protein